MRGRAAASIVSGNAGLNWVGWWIEMFQFVGFFVLLLWMMMMMSFMLRGWWFEVCFFGFRLMYLGRSRMIALFVRVLCRLNVPCNYLGRRIG